MHEASDALEVIEALAAHEEAMSALYSAYARQYPEVAELWTTLAREEYGHAKLLRSLPERSDDVGAFVQARGFDPAQIRGETKKLLNLVQLASAAGLPLQEAFRSAVKLEDSLIESQVLVTYEEDPPEIAAVLDTLREQTERHHKHLSESMSDFSKQ
jgi:rubrerythrin